MVTRIRPNRAGRAQILRSAAMAKAVERQAEQIAAKVRTVMVEGEPGDIEIPVEVAVYETDVARASVVLAHPAGLAVQAKHGVLSRAAADLGLEVNG